LVATEENTGHNDTGRPTKTDRIGGGQGKQERTTKEDVALIMRSKSKKQTGKRPPAVKRVTVASNNQGGISSG